MDTDKKLTSSHLKYLLAIYEESQDKIDVSSARVAERLNVSKPSVSSMLTALMNRELLVKERYGKIYLTDTGFLIAKDLFRNIEAVKQELARMPFQLSEQELHSMAAIIVTEMSDRQFADELTA